MTCTPGAGTSVQYCDSSSRAIPLMSSFTHRYLRALAFADAVRHALQVRVLRGTVVDRTRANTDDVGPGRRSLHERLHEPCRVRISPYPTEDQNSLACGDFGGETNSECIERVARENSACVRCRRSRADRQL